MHSSIRLPRLAQSTPRLAKSSGHGEMPTPRPSRLSERNASDDACLATSTGGRTGSLSTNGVSRSVVGHREQVRAEHHRLDELLAVEELAVPGVGVGVLRVGLLGVDQAVGHGHRRVAGGLGGLGQRGVVLRLGHRLGVGESHRAGRAQTRTCSSFVPEFGRGPPGDQRPARDRRRAHPLHAGHRHRRLGQARHGLHRRTPRSTTPSPAASRRRTRGQALAGRGAAGVLPEADAHARPDRHRPARRRGRRDGVLPQPDADGRRPGRREDRRDRRALPPHDDPDRRTAGAAASCTKRSSGSATSDDGPGFPRSGPTGSTRR